jgi:hypothetical protein
VREDLRGAPATKLCVRRITTAPLPFVVLLSNGKVFPESDREDFDTGIPPLVPFDTAPNDLGDRREQDGIVTHASGVEEKTSCAAAGGLNSYGIV